jgi:hypothetical protein
MTTESEWLRYRRRGDVTAEKRPIEWTRAIVCAPVPMTGPSIDDAGRERSVATDVFESTYEQIGPGTAA